MSASSFPRTLVVSAGVVVGLALVGLATLMAVNSNQSAVQEAVALAQEGDSASEDEQQDVIDSASIDVTYEVFIQRDPFEPVVPEPVADAPSDPSDPSDPTDPSNPTDPTDPADPAQPGAPGTPSGPPVEVVEITEAAGDPLAIIRVGSTTYEVRVGELFATDLRLISIDGDCATWLRGDQSQTGCVGAVVK